MILHPMILVQLTLLLPEEDQSESQYYFEEKCDDHKDSLSHGDPQVMKM